jgi:signal transduction histidine kinase
VARFRIRDRIVIPFVLMALVATVSAALIALSLISRTLESRIEAQMASGSALVSHSHFALNQAILPLVKEIANADVITYARDGTFLAGTVGPRSHRELVAAVIGGEGATTYVAPAQDFSLRRLTHDGTPYVAAYRRLAGRPDVTVAFIADTSDIAAGLRAARQTILLTAGVSLLLLVGVSQIVARRVSAPIEQLVDFTRTVGSGRTGDRLPTAGGDEVAKLAEAFNDMLDRLQQSQEALVRSEKLAVTGLLAARVAHDVRNPLSSIKMQTQLLRSRLRDDADSQALLRSMLDGIGHVETVVRGLLELARPGTLVLRRTRLNDVVEDVVRELSAQMSHRKIAVETQLDRGLPEIPLDAQRFRQALLNVIANATDAMPAGGTLFISTAAGADGSEIVLDVCDDGAGIDPSVRDRLFDPFVSTKRDGVGLGLVNTKAVVESHRGRIELSARAGGGTRARITLPGTQA